MRSLIQYAGTEGCFVEQRPSGRSSSAEIHPRFDVHDEEYVQIQYLFMPANVDRSVG